MGVMARLLNNERPMSIHMYTRSKRRQTLFIIFKYTLQLIIRNEEYSLFLHCNIYVISNVLSIFV